MVLNIDYPMASKVLARFREKLEVKSPRVPCSNNSSIQHFPQVNYYFHFINNMEADEGTGQRSIHYRGTHR